MIGSDFSTFSINKAASCSTVGWIAVAAVIALGLAAPAQAQQAPLAEIKDASDATVFQVSYDGALLGLGTFGTGAIPAEGPGTRLMWYPAKAAFRAGSVNGTQWDDASVGDYSTAMGQGTEASGFGSTAMGGSTTASGLRSTAMGFFTTASGDISIAMGTGARASGLRSTAMGNGTTASGDISTALGNQTVASGGNSTAMGDQTVASGNTSTAMGASTTASGNNSVAMGNNTTASGNNSIAMGSRATASGFGSTTMGGDTEASGTYSTAMGNNTTASGFYSTAMGFSTTSQSFASLATGRFNVVQGNATSWVATDPLFVVGNGSNNIFRSNALTLLKNGDLTIAGTLTQNSDRRLKTDIVPLSGVLGSLTAIPAVRYRFRSGTNRPDGTQIGVLAQDVQAVFPELVSEGADGYLSVSYSKLTAVLVQGLQEQQTQIETLEARIAALERGSVHSAPASVLGGVPVSAWLVGLALLGGWALWRRRSPATETN